MAKRILLLTTALALIAGGAGCSLRSVATSVPPRVFRELHGLRVRSYQMMPVTNDLRQYKAIESTQGSPLNCRVKRAATTWSEFRLMNAIIEEIEAEVGKEQVA